jgi:NADH:ubiquinone oxidoreductase subunit 6 (subunit J)
MKKKLLEATSAMKMMWVCIAIIAVAGILVASGLNFGYGALFLIPCMIMMGAMMWMMGGGARGGQQK